MHSAQANGSYWVIYNINVCLLSTCGRGGG